VTIVTLSDGEITPLHIGWNGTMGALAFKDLADKTRRGLRGRVEKGRSGGGLSYGYRVLPEGDRSIDEAEAEVVRRIFREYAAGASPASYREAVERGGGARAEWRTVGTQHGAWTHETWDGHSQQRSLRRSQRVEPSTLREEPRDR
jgi:DNA invertase Pin-like site-specific DNA recombinase